MKKRGFTLVELLAVITILAVILLITVPSLLNSISSKKHDALDKIYDLIETSAMNYVMDYNVERPAIISIEKLCVNYIECPIINPVTNEEIDGYIFFDGNYKFTTKGEVSLTVNYNGGTSNQTFNDKYLPGQKIELEPPTSQANTFVRWNLVQGNSILDGNTLTIGTEDTILYAMWNNMPYFLIDLDGGTTTNDDKGYYDSGTTIELEVPIKEGYVFKGWKIINGDGIISGNTFTMGNIDTTIKAIWKLDDDIAPTCNLVVSTAGISATYSDSGGSGVMYYGWDASYSGLPSVSKSLAIGTHTYYVMDAAENTGTCSVTITSTSTVRTCPTGYNESTSSDQLKYGECWDWDTLQNKTHYASKVTSYVCSSGYTKLSNSYCYKIN